MKSSGKKLAGAAFLVLALVLLVLFPSFAQDKAGSAADIKSFAQYLTQKPAELRTKELEITESEYRELKISRKASYLELVKYYQSFAKILKRWFPDAELEYSGLTTLEPYFGSRNIDQFVVVSNPLLLIHAPVLNAEKNKYVGLEADYQGKKISGLRVETSLPKSLKRAGNEPLYDFYYLADVNARVFGFTHGQVIMSLSDGVTVSKEFEYNGARPWSKHKRYKARDQIEQPIALTNYGHSSKKTYYYVSDHPDFALECLDCANKDVKITWFFWREGFVASVRKESVASPKRLPDFIFQVYLSK